MEIHISRAGKIIAKYADAEIAGLLKNKTILPTDFWWKKGMKDWVKIADGLPPPGIEASLPTPAGSSEQSWKTPPAHIPSKFGDEPATEKQMAFISEFGITPPKELTKYDAIRWLDMLMENPEAKSVLEDIRTQKMMDKMTKDADSGFGCDGYRTPSGYYRADMDCCLESAAESRKAMEEEINEADEYMKVRAEFWESVFKSGNPNIPGGDEDAMENYICEIGQEATDRALLEKLARRAAKVGRIPKRKEIERALALADAVSKTWDDDNPQLFFDKLTEVIS